MENYQKACPSHAGQVLFTCGETAVSVHLDAIGRDGCRLPHAGAVQPGQALALKFLDGVEVRGFVERIEGALMDVRFERSVSRALVDYFAPYGSAPRASSAIRDGFGRILPPLDGDRPVN